MALILVDEFQLALPITVIEIGFRFSKGIDSGNRNPIRPQQI